MTDPYSGASDCLDIFNAVHGGREVVTQHVVFFAAKRADHDQNPASNSSLTKRDTFIGRSDPEP